MKNLKTQEPEEKTIITKTEFVLLVKQDELAVEITQKQYYEGDETAWYKNTVILPLNQWALLVEKVNEKSEQIEKTLKSQLKFEFNEKGN